MDDLLPGFVQPVDVPARWETAQVRDIASVVQGGRFGLTKASYRESGVPAFSAAGQDGFVSQAEFNQPGVVLSSIGANCGRCFRADGSWTTLANTQAILPDSAKVDHRFLFARLNHERYWLRSGSAQPFIKPASVKASWILIPPLEEQQRIAEILDTIDETIQATERVIAKLELIEDGMKWNLLGQPAEADADWDRVTISDLGSVVTGGTPPTSDERYWDGLIPFITPGDINSRGEVDITDRRVSELGANLGKRIPPGAVAVVCIGSTIGKVGRVYEISVTNQQINTIIPSPEYDSEFVACVLELARPSLEVAAGRQAVPIINARVLRSLFVQVCPLQLQRDIAAQIISLRGCIKREHSVLTKLQQIRSGLAADLLLGRVRTVAA